MEEYTRLNNFLQEIKNEKSTIDRIYKLFQKFYLRGAKKYRVTQKLGYNALISGYLCFIFLLSFSLNKNMDRRERKSIAKRCRSYALLYVWVDGVFDSSEMSEGEKNLTKSLIIRTLREEETDADKNNVIYILYKEVVKTSSDVKSMKELYGVIIQSLAIQKDMTASTDKLREITYLKGGTSVYVALCIIYGRSSFKKSQIFQIGYCIQLLDDLMDCRDDLKHDIVTLATSRVRKGKNLDGLAKELEREIYKIDDDKYSLCLYAALNGIIMKSAFYSSAYRYKKKLRWISMYRDLNIDSKTIETMLADTIKEI